MGTIDQKQAIQAREAFLSLKARHIVYKRIKRAQRRARAAELASQKPVRGDKLLKEWEFYTEGL